MTPTSTPPAQPRAPTTDPVPVVVRVTVVTAPEPERPRAPGFVERNRTVLWFVVLLVLADLGVGLLAPVWERYSPDDYTARVNGCAERRRDVVFVGGSPVAEGIDPAIVAGALWRGRPLRDAYAVGLSGGTTTDVYYATVKACPVPPRVLVYGVTASDLNDNRNEPHSIHSLLTRSDVREIARTRPDASEWVIRHYLESQLDKASSIYRYRHGVRMWAGAQADRVFPDSRPDEMREAGELREHAEDLARGTGYAPLRGYSRINYAQTKAHGVPPNPFGYLDRYRTGSHLEYLHKLAQWCRAHGVELVLLDMPVTADLEARHPAAFAEYRGRLAEVERDYGPTVLRATRDAAGLTDEHFADLIHLTPDGCKRLSLWLRWTLQQAASSRALEGGVP